MDIYAQPTQPLITADFSQDESNDLDDNLLSFRRGKPLAHMILESSGDTFLIYRGKNLIGRNADCNIILDKTNTSVSKRHACIEVVNDDHLIFDLNSLNKTKLKTKVLLPEVRYELVDGAMITFGDIRCSYKKLKATSASQCSTLSADLSITSTFKSIVSTLLANHINDDVDEEIDATAKLREISAKKRVSFGNQRDENREDHSTILAQETPYFFDEQKIEPTKERLEILDDSSNRVSTQDGDNEKSLSLKKLIPETQNETDHSENSALILRLSVDSENEELVSVAEDYSQEERRSKVCRSKENNVQKLGNSVDNKKSRESRSKSAKSLVPPADDKPLSLARKSKDSRFQKTKTTRKNSRAIAECKIIIERSENVTRMLEQMTEELNDDQPLKLLKEKLSASCKSAKTVATKTVTNIGMTPKPTDAKNKPKNLKRKRECEDEDISLQEIKNAISKNTIGPAAAATKGRKRMRNDENDSLEHSLISPKSQKQCSSKLSKQCMSSKKMVLRNMKIALTGFEESDVLQLMQLVKELGGQVVESVKEATCLVTDNVKRTSKLLCALARGRPIVTSSWLRKCSECEENLNFTDYVVRDTSLESQYDFNFQHSIEFAEDKPMLQGFSIFVTPSVKPGAKQMNEIVESAGALSLKKFPTKRTCTPNTILVSCPEDLSVFSSKAKSLNIPMVSSEFVLTGILQQKIDLKRFALQT